MKNSFKKILFLVLSLSWILAGQMILADSYGLDTAAKQALLPGGDLPTVPTLIGAKIITPAMTLVGTIFLCLMVYAGFLWMTARGDKTQVAKATGLIFDAVVGLIVVLGAYAITYFVINAIGQ